MSTVTNREQDESVADSDSLKVSTAVESIDSDSFKVSTYHVYYRQLQWELVVVVRLAQRCQGSLVHLYPFIQGATNHSWYSEKESSNAIVSKHRSCTFF